MASTNWKRSASGSSDLPRSLSFSGWIFNSPSGPAVCTGGCLRVCSYLCPIWLIAFLLIMPCFYSLVGQAVIMVAIVESNRGRNILKGRSEFYSHLNLRVCLLPSGNLKRQVVQPDPGSGSAGSVASFSCTKPQRCLSSISKELQGLTGTAFLQRSGSCSTVPKQGRLATSIPISLTKARVTVTLVYAGADGCLMYNAA